MRLSNKLICKIILVTFFLFSFYAYADDLKHAAHEDVTQQTPTATRDNGDASTGRSISNAEQAKRVSLPAGKAELWSLSALLFHVTAHLIAELIVFVLFLILAVIGWKKYVTPENIEKYLHRRISPSKNMEHCETQKSILEKNEIITEINLHEEVLNKDDLYEELIRTKSIIKQWDHNLDKPLTFDWERFFDTEEASITKMKIASEIVKRHKKLGISGIILLPFERSSVAFPVQHIAKQVEEGLKDGNRKFFKLPVNKGTIDKEELKDYRGFQEGDKVLIVQPVAARDGFVYEVMKYLQKEKKADIKGIITIFDFVDYAPRPTYQGEEVLIKLNLYYKYQ
jgi:hypothetical protein